MTDQPADMARAPLTLDRIAPGEALPPLAHEVTATTVVSGAFAARDYRPMHHDHRFAVERSGIADIFLDTPTQAAWFERFLTDWTGPLGRLGWLTVRMQRPVFPGDVMTLSGRVRRAEVDATGCGWVDVDLRMTVDGQTRSGCSARVAVPVDAGDNPWDRRGDRWRP